jgi:hypothetical protein
MRYDFRTLLLLTAFLLVVTSVSTFLHFATRPIVFSPDAWQTYPRQRPRMVKDLLASRPLDGKSRAEVEAILGAPDSGSDDERLVYWAGSSGIDDMWLEIRLRSVTVVDVKCRPD